MIESNFNKSAMRISEFTEPFKVQREQAENEIRKKTRINRIIVLSGLALTIGSLALGVIFLTFTVPGLPVALAFTAACLSLPLSSALTFNTEKLEKVIENQDCLIRMQATFGEYKKIRSENFSCSKASDIIGRINGIIINHYDALAPEKWKGFQKERETLHTNLTEWRDACFKMTSGMTLDSSIPEKFKFSMDKMMAEIVKIAEELEKEYQISLDSQCPRTGTVFIMKKIKAIKNIVR